MKTWKGLMLKKDTSESAVPADCNGQTLSLQLQVTQGEKVPYSSAVLRGGTRGRTYKDAENWVWCFTVIPQLLQHPLVFQFIMYSYLILSKPHWVHSCSFMSTQDTQWYSWVLLQLSANHDRAFIIFWPDCYHIHASQVKLICWATWSQVSQNNSIQELNNLIDNTEDLKDDNNDEWQANIDTDVEKMLQVILNETLLVEYYFAMWAYFPLMLQGPHNLEKWCSRLLWRMWIFTWR